MRNGIFICPYRLKSKMTRMNKTWKPTTTGILNIVSGASNLIGGVVVAFLGLASAKYISSYVTESLELEVALTQSTVVTVIVLLALLIIFHGIVSVLGGFYALKRRAWWIALTGSIFTFLANPLLGIPAIVFIALSRREFI